MVVNDQQAGVALVAAFEVSAVVRERDPLRTAAAAQRVLDACGGDPIAAIAVMATIGPATGRIYEWWLDDMDTADVARLSKWKRDAVETAIARREPVDRILVDCGVTYAEFKGIKAEMNRAAHLEALAS